MTAFVRPELTDVNRGFWDGAARHRLAVQRCGGCGELRYPPARRCPRCLSGDWSWHDLSGRGEILSYIYVHQRYHPAWADRVPYNVVLVQLDEGPRMVSNVMPLSRADLDVGQRVRVVFADEDGLTVPRFEVDEETGT
nr:OB-fold domain-containing protein [Micromonospora sp. DSM 115978]